MGRAQRISRVGYWWLHVIHLSKPTECAPPSMNPNENYRHWVIKMCQCRLISCNQCTILVGILIVEEVKLMMAQGVMGNLCFTLSFAVNLNCSKKIKLNLKNTYFNSVSR